MCNNGYPRGYREDEEMYVYDQCCDNCAHQGADCPFEPYVGDEHAPKRKKKQMKEDAIIRGEELEWCIHWGHKRGCRF